MSLQKCVRVLLLAATALPVAPLSLLAADAVQLAERPVLTVDLPEERTSAEPLDGPVRPVVGLPGIPSEDEEKEGKAAPALAQFRSAVVSHGKRYTFTMVGSNPFVRNARNVTIPVQIFPVRFEFGDGSVLDPTLPNPCLGGAIPLDLVLQSPLFQNVNYGDGPRQFVEEIRRLEFWSYTGPRTLNPRYSVRVAPSVPATIRVTIPNGATHAGSCGRVGVIDRASWQTILTQLLPQLRKLGVSPQTFPLFLTDTAETIYPDGSYSLGFHTALGTQTWGVALWDATGQFPDISILSHELAEWYDDPFVNNPTPSWGHIGQVDGCQANLEVGDPLTGTYFGAIRMSNGYVYHPQETAFFSWFYGQVPSWGIGGWYSSANTLRSPAAVCH
jgi:hypothetical protein